MCGRRRATFGVTAMEPTREKKGVFGGELAGGKSRVTSSTGLYNGLADRLREDDALIRRLQESRREQRCRQVYQRTGARCHNEDGDTDTSAEGESEGRSPHPCKGATYIRCASKSPTMVPRACFAGDLKGGAGTGSTAASALPGRRQLTHRQKKLIPRRLPSKPPTPRERTD